MVGTYSTGKTGLKPAMGLASATAMVVGIIVGASIFVQPSVITARVPSVPGIIGAWLAAGVLTLFGALVAAELATAFPRSGGVYVFLSEAWGRWLGFLWGWAMFWSMHSGILAAIAVVFARYVGSFAPLGPTGQRAVAIGAVLALSAVNYFGVRAGSRVQTTLTVVKVAAILGIVALAFGVGPRIPVPPIHDARFALPGFVLAVGAGVFAFGGWHMVTYASEETLVPERTIPRALLLGTVIVTACYIAMNAAYLHVLPMGDVIASTGVAADAANAVLGSGGARLASAIVLISTLGALNGIVLAGPRVYYAMAQDGLIFKWMGAIHPTFRTPHRAIVLQAIWTSVLIATGTYQALVSRVVYTEWIFFALMALGALALRRRPGYAPAFRAPGFPVTPLLFAAAAIALVAGQIKAEPLSSALGLGMVLIGLPLYFKRRDKGETGEAGEARLETKG